VKAQSKIIPFKGTGYNRLEVHTCFDTGDNVEREPQGEDLAEDISYFWSLYGINLDGTREALGDFNSFEAACEIAEKLQPCRKYAYKVGENIAAISRELNDDKVYPFCNGGFPDLFLLSVELAVAGEKLHGEAWQEGQRDWLDDVTSACRNLEAYVVESGFLPASDFEQFWK
jgi:hypothetical protein